MRATGGASALALVAVEDEPAARALSRRLLEDVAVHVLLAPVAPPDPEAVVTARRAGEHPRLGRVARVELGTPVVALRAVDVDRGSQRLSIDDLNLDRVAARRRRDPLSSTEPR